MKIRHDVQPVLLCGGSGTRLWPLSRTGFPKQFLCLSGTDSLFQQGARRLSQLASDDLAVAAPLIVGNEEHRFMALEQLREAGIEAGTAVLEPIGRNTAPALTMAALAAIEDGHDPILVATPSDQAVADPADLVATLREAVRSAADGAIVILGVAPCRAETGYGYIKTAASTGAAAAREVECFVEKPDAATAQRYLDAGGYFWNAGVFVLKASVWLAALERFRPDIAAACRLAWEQRDTDTSTSACFIRPARTAFAAIPAESVDRAVMEHCPGSEIAIRMLPLAAGWSDLGAWDAVWQHMEKDSAGNAHFGDVLAIDSRNTLVHATSRLVGLVGVDNVAVVETSDAVLVVNLNCCQDVNAIVAELHAKGREEHCLHRKVHRPWGWYDGIDDGLRFKVKRIQVKPKACLSLQMHHHRAEHWIVVKGTAEITNGNKISLLTENQSTYIPLGETHRLANPGTIPLEIIEVQSGSYLGEDDIVRFEDIYERGSPNGQG